MCKRDKSSPSDDQHGWQCRKHDGFPEKLYDSKPVSPIRQRRFWFSVMLLFVAFEILMQIPKEQQKKKEKTLSTENHGTSSLPSSHHSVAAAALTLMEDDEHHYHESKNSDDTHKIRRSPTSKPSTSSSSGGSRYIKDSQSKRPSFQPFSFFLMGDIPYSEWEESMLSQQIEDLNQRVASNAATTVFSVHVGDIQKAHRTNCAESHYKKIQRLLRKSVVPTFTIPGDNDWYDCPDRNLAWSYFQEHFVGLEQRWSGTQELGVSYHETRRELFAFQREGILFVSIHLIHAEEDQESPDSWNARMRLNIGWVNRVIETHAVPPTSTVRGVLILGHSLRSPRTRPFFEGIVGNFINGTQRMQNMPVLYLHGDGHNWDVDSKFSSQLGWKYYRDIQVDQGGLGDPCIVEIAGEDKHGNMIPLLEKTSSQYVFGDGMFRIDRQSGRYNEKKITEFAEKLKSEKRSSR